MLEKKTNSDNIYMYVFNCYNEIQLLIYIPGRWMRSGHGLRQYYKVQTSHGSMVLADRFGTLVGPPYRLIPKILTIQYIYMYFIIWFSLYIHNAMWMIDD